MVGFADGEPIGLVAGGLDSPPATVSFFYQFTESFKRIYHRLSVNGRCCRDRPQGFASADSSSEGKVRVHASLVEAEWKVLRGRQQWKTLKLVDVHWYIFRL